MLSYLKETIVDNDPSCSAYKIMILSLKRKEKKLFDFFKLRFLEYTYSCILVNWIKTESHQFRGKIHRRNLAKDKKDILRNRFRRI